MIFYKLKWMVKNILFLKELIIASAYKANDVDY